jgi:hypothetical protein
MTFVIICGNLGVAQSVKTHHFNLFDRKKFFDLGHNPYPVVIFNLNWLDQRFF